MDPNHEDELRLATFTTMPQLLGKNKAENYEHLDWFYKQVRDILERDHKEERLKD